MHNSFEEELTEEHHLLTIHAQEQMTQMKHKTDIAFDSEIQTYKYAAKIQAQEAQEKVNEHTLSSVTRTNKSYDKASSPIATRPIKRKKKLSKPKPSTTTDNDPISKMEIEDEKPGSPICSTVTMTLTPISQPESMAPTASPIIMKMSLVHTDLPANSHP